MIKIDYRKRLKALYSAPARMPVIVEVPALSFLMVDGAGDPNSAPEFQEAVEALFSAAYNPPADRHHVGWRLHHR